ncbi:hypothetical protein HOK51_08675 [Candidatus Woesearchaeota archaeon]|nr:hypothetical protein [Candidatus Woesearchaeota archaeon]MBT6519901.1 hypothetical protein [Candidatus Woesearchaeota archaeon]MBT7367123.1 hypothetical protein [Candidatus Woesearchaeota archaeon]
MFRQNVEYAEFKKMANYGIMSNFLWKFWDDDRKCGKIPTKMKKLV